MDKFCIMEAREIPLNLGTFSYDGIIGLFPSEGYKTDNTYLPKAFHNSQLSIIPRFSIFLSEDDESDT